MVKSARGLVYLILALVVDVPAAVLLLAAGMLGTVLLLTPLGAWLLALMLLAADGLAGARRRLAARLLGEDVATPERTRRAGGWRRQVLTDQARWRAFAYAMAKLPVSVLSLVVGGGAYAYAIVTLTYFPLQDHRPGSWLAVVAAWAAGAVLLAGAPWLLRSVLAVERLMIRGLLGPSAAAGRIADLRETRDRAVVDADATLRRIERDLHDGAQARLVGVGMHLTLVRELVAAGAPPDRVRTAVDTAQLTLTAAIAELRDLVRGIHPPVLDRGLEAALATVAAGSAVPMLVEVVLPRRPPPAIESIAYFTICELVTNAHRHSGAGRLTVLVERTDLLRLTVRDDGVGGAHFRPGGGLAGLTDRLRVADGRLTVHSPPGGPTTVVVEIPCS